MVARAFAACATAWTAALPLAALAGGVADAGWWMQAPALAAYAVGSFICHQNPDRSFHLLGAALPVCARCTGVYAGASLAAVTLGWSRVGCSRPPGLLTLTRTAASARRLLVLGTLPTVGTLVFEWSTGITPSNPLRAAAGLVLGSAVAWVIVSAIVGSQPDPASESRRV